MKPDHYALLAQIVFGSAEDLQRALESPERAEARVDLARFPAFGGRVFHQAVSSEEVFRA